MNKYKIFLDFLDTLIQKRQEALDFLLLVDHVHKYSEDTHPQYARVWADAQRRVRSAEVDIYDFCVKLQHAGYTDDDTQSWLDGGRPKPYPRNNY